MGHQYDEYKNPKCASLFLTECVCVFLNKNQTNTIKSRNCFFAYKNFAVECEKRRRTHYTAVKWCWESVTLFRTWTGAIISANRYSINQTDSFQSVLFDHSFGAYSSEFTVQLKFTGKTWQNKQPNSRTFISNLLYLINRYKQNELERDANKTTQKISSSINVSNLFYFIVQHLVVPIQTIVAIVEFIRAIVKREEKKTFSNQANVQLFSGWCASLFL